MSSRFLIADAAMAALVTGEFERARGLFETLLVLGDLPPLLRGAYALALSELGEAERAAEMSHCLPDELAQLLRPWLEGGGLERARREALRSDAERLLPRGP